MISEAEINLGIVGLTCMLLVVYLVKFVYKYKHQYESNPLCTFAVIFCLLVVLMITCILPVDIFMVSFVKNSDGTFKKWATNETLTKIDDFMFATYYSLYGLAITLVFIVIPFLHFFNDETNSNSRSRFHSAIKFTFGSIVLMLTLLFAGAFIHKENFGPNTIFEEIITIRDETKLQSAISFVLTIITLLGFINVSFYTASGIFSWPIGLILGQNSLDSRYGDVSDRTDLLRIQVSTLKQKAQVDRLSQREQEQLDRAEEELLRLDREEAVLSTHRSTWSYKLRKLIRPIQIFIGSLLVLLSLIILATLLITDIDRILNSGGPKTGYILPKPRLFNPMEYVFTKAQDLIVIGPMPLLIILCFLVVATISGIRNLGLWLMLARLHRVKVGRTPPQALLFFCITIMLTALAFNLLLYSMASHYITFGNQNYQSSPALTALEYSGNGASGGNNNGTTTTTTTAAPSVMPEIKSCNFDDYPKHKNDCILTRGSILLMRMMSQLWVFGAIFYWSSWIFVAIGLVSLIAYIYRGKRQAAHDLVADEDEFEE